jgi:hypothetical protein
MTLRLLLLLLWRLGIIERTELMGSSWEGQMGDKDDCDGIRDWGLLNSDWNGNGM